MNCLICKAEAARIKALGDWVEQECPECGHFRVSGTLFAEMKPRHQEFDVQKTRAWLEEQRSGEPEGHTPLIDSCDSNLITT